MAESKRTTDRQRLDDAAARALFTLASEPVEHIGLLYEQDGQILATPTHSQRHDSRTRGAFAIPEGSLRAIFHNHPPKKLGRGDLSRGDRRRNEFSLDDIRQAQKLGVPSYIAAGPKLRRYDPATGQIEDVLAEIPVELIRDYIHRRLFEGRNE